MRFPTMQRQTYKGYIIDWDDLGRLYIYNTKSPYAEDSDRNYNCGSTVREAKALIDWLVTEKED